jgi:tetratricopeptide (TPR) repeat protein
MTFLAYLGSSGLNFELFSSARIKAFIYRAEWLNALVGTKTLFNKAMATLHSYSLVEHSAQGYSLHTCVHEWTLQILNKDFRPPYFWDAMMCIAANVRPVTDMEYSAQNNQRILTHATQLWKIQLREPIYEPLVEPNQAYSLRWLSYLWRQHGDNSKAEVLLIHAYGAYEKLLGGHHVLTLEVVVDLADTYEQMDRSAEAEGLYKQVLGHYDHISRPTQENIDSRARHNLALSYRSQHKFNAAEGLLRTALAGEEETLGIGYPSTMQTATSLASVLTRQGKFLEAEALSKRATDELTRTLGPDHPLTLDALNTRGDVHFDQGQWEQAGTVFKLVIAGMQRNSGSIDAKTLRAVRQLGTTYIKGSNLGGLLELATEWGSRDRFVYEQLTKLGRTSLRRGDQKTARIAYANSLYINDGVLLCPQLAYCDLCQLQPKDDDKITLEMGRFICLTCADVDLCRTCYGKYQRAEESVPGCVRHGFFEMPSKRFSDQGKTCP